MAVSVAPGITVSSSDGGLNGATVTISAGTLQSGDTLSFTSPAGSGISGSYAAGVLTLSGTATPAQYQAALQSVTFSSTSTSTTARSISIVAIDNNLDSGPVSEQVNVDAPATITGLWVKGSSWNSGFDNYLAKHSMGSSTTPSLGYALQTGSGQSQVLPWVNLNVIEAQFSVAVNVTQSSLMLSGGTGGSTPSVTGFSSLGNNTYAWTLSSSLTNNRYEISFMSSGSRVVTDANGAGISGNWTNGSSTFPSGNGLAGSGMSSDFNFLFNVLPGDAARNGSSVNASDYLDVKAMVNQNTSGSNYTPYFDVLGSGAINASDYLDVQARVNQAQPPSSMAPSPRHSGVGSPATTDADADLSGAMLAVQEGSTSQTGGAAAPAASSQTSGGNSSSSSSGVGGSNSDTSGSSAISLAADTTASDTDATDAAVSDFDLADLYV